MQGDHWCLAGLWMMRPYLVWTGVYAAGTEDCAGTGVDLCVGCVDEGNVLGCPCDDGQPITGVPGCPARCEDGSRGCTLGCWSEDAWKGSCLTIWTGEKTAPMSDDRGHLVCVQMDQSISGVADSVAADLLASGSRMNVECISSPPLLATSSTSLHPFLWGLGRRDIVPWEVALGGSDCSFPSDAASWPHHAHAPLCDCCFVALAFQHWRQWWHGGEQLSFHG